MPQFSKPASDGRMKGRLIIEVIAAKVHPPSKQTKPYDCCVVITVGSKKKKTKVKRKTFEPEWKEFIEFEEFSDEDEIVVELWDSTRFGSATKIASAKIPFLSEMKLGVNITEKIWKLDDSKSEILLSISFLELVGMRGSRLFSDTELTNLNLNKSLELNIPEKEKEIKLEPSSTSSSTHSPLTRRKTQSFGSTLRNYHDDVDDATQLKNIFNVTEELQTACSCSLKGVGSGKLFVTNSAMYFYYAKRGEEHKEAIPYKEVSDIVKQNTIFLVPNAMEIQTSTSKHYLFFGFSNRDVVYKLVKKLKNQEVKTKTLKEGETPLFAAVMRNELLSVQELLKTCITKEEINLQDKYGFTVLHSAAGMSDINVTILKELLDFDGIRADIKNNDLNEPLHYFCHKFSHPDECQEILEMILKKGGNINAQNKVGETPLHKAMFNNAIRLILVDLLLENGADASATNHSGETPLHYAARYGRKDLIQALVSGGANISGRDSKEQSTPYDLAVKWGYDEMASHLRRVQDLSDWLKKNDLENLFQTFVKQELFLEECESINEPLLEKMGISAIGSRIKIMKAVEGLKIEKQSGASPQKQPEEAKHLGLIRKAMSELAITTNLNSDSWIKHTELEFTKKLGSGTSGKVYQGLYKGKEVAIKVMREMTEEQQITDFKKEFQVMSSIKSPKVVTFFGACWEPKLCMVMEICSRGSLYGVLQDTSVELSWYKYFDFIAQIVEGIHTLHNWNPQILHRDIKTLNFLVTKDWQIKVADFGLSRFNTAPNLATMQKICGTVAYLAPEVYMGEKYTTKADMFSLGIVLWEVTNRAMRGTYDSPYREYGWKFDWQILLAVTQSNQRPSLPDHCPPEIKQLLADTLHSDPQKRPEARELLASIGKIATLYQANMEAWDALLTLGCAATIHEQTNDATPSNGTDPGTHSSDGGHSANFSSIDASALMTASTGTMDTLSGNLGTL